MYFAVQMEEYFHALVIKISHLPAYFYRFRFRSNRDVESDAKTRNLSTVSMSE